MFKRKNITHGILFALAAAGAFSCNRPTTGTAEKILSVSIEPQRYFLETIVGDKFQVNSVIAPGANPESFDPAPAQMLALSKSSAYFKIGRLNFENAWLNKLKENEPTLKIVDCSEGLRAVLKPAANAHSDHAGDDPHIWSSPRTALVIAQNMYGAVVAIDPENKAFYEQNMQRLLSEFTRTDSIIRSYLDDAPCKSFYIYHAALGYFADEYGLTQRCIEQDGKSPTPAQLKQSIDLARQENIRVVFIQAEYDRKNAETLADEIGAKVVPIDLLSYRWSDELIKIAQSIAAANE
ncbi:MAG: zinc ABC transporter substrate-binding protein [Prevotella sp.]|jgi:zinc transport system substrate-binding protein|nr:zinc ABC transporter substrate-binding protein [Prevotella sp.]